MLFISAYHVTDCSNFRISVTSFSIDQFSTAASCCYAEENSQTTVFRRQNTQNVAWMKRQFTARQTPRSNHYVPVADWSNPITWKSWTPCFVQWDYRGRWLREWLMPVFRSCLKSAYADFRSSVPQNKMAADKMSKTAANPCLLILTQHRQVARESVAKAYNLTWLGSN